MDYYDLEPTPPVLKHFDFANYTEWNGFVDEQFSKVKNRQKNNKYLKHNILYKWK